MNIDCLRYFVEVAKYKNISVVAKNFHITQSALSQQLSKLEQNLNSKLLERSNRGVVLTKDGELLLKYSETILNTFDKMMVDLNNLHQDKTNITIESLESLSTSILPNVISKIKKENPVYYINLKTNDGFSISNLLNDISDIYICYKAPESTENLINKKLGEDKILLVSDISYPLDSVDKTDFSKLPFILSLDKYAMTKEIEDSLENCIDSIDDLNIIYSTNSYFSAINGLKTSKAVTLIPSSIYNSYKDTHHLKVINVPDFNLRLDIYINYTVSFYKNNTEFIKLFTKILKSYL